MRLGNSHALVQVSGGSCSEPGPLFGNGTAGFYKGVPQACKCGFCGLQSPWQRSGTRGERNKRQDDRRSRVIPIFVVFPCSGYMRSSLCLHCTRVCANKMRKGQTMALFFLLEDEMPNKPSQMGPHEQANKMAILFSSFKQSLIILANLCFPFNSKPTWYSAFRRWL